MIKSIRYFLLISLLLSITIASTINGVGNFLLDEKVIQPFLDLQLVRTSNLLQALYHYEPQKNIVDKTHFLNYIKKTLFHESNFFYQIWSLDKHTLLINSKENIIPPLHKQTNGFSDRVFSGQQWRLYTAINPADRVKIIVAEHYDLRRELGDSIIRSNAHILLVTYPVFGLLVWLIVSIALRSVTRVTNEISNRAHTHLDPVGLNNIPNEIAPLVQELNRLFQRLKSAFERNKRFAADAAHELRTPLAAIKTHLEIALKVNDPVDLKIALNSVIQGVDRSAHIVDQLLTLSRLSDEETLADIKPIELNILVREVVAYAATSAIEKNIEIELNTSNSKSFLLGNEISLSILIRNIVDNAIRYTPEGGQVTINILTTEDKIYLQTIDSGPGIPLELRERVFERFYRVLGNKVTGSGLGLAIVKQISKLHYAEIYLNTAPSGKGLQFDVAFPRYQA